MDPDPTDVPQVARAIRTYLAAHPRAADTATGIQRWWLAPVLGEVALQTVEDALESLEADGVVDRFGAAGAAPTFALSTRAP